MISEKLSALSDGVKPGCRVPSLLNELSPSDAESLLKALANPLIPRRKIVAILNGEGHKISRDAIIRASECVNNKRSCGCGLPERCTK